jgi:hypothetical protein
METQQAEPSRGADGRAGAGFLEERSRLRENIEMANATKTRLAGLRQQIEMLLAEIGAAQKEWIALGASLDGELAALQQPVIDRRPPGPPG